jgi:hypothetical protein
MVWGETTGVTQVVLHVDGLGWTGWKYLNFLKEARGFRKKWIDPLKGVRNLPMIWYGKNYYPVEPSMKFYDCSRFGVEHIIIAEGG